MSTFLLPVTAAGQAGKPADLVGTWVHTQWSLDQPDSQYVQETIWTFRADGTWSVRGRRNGIEDTSFHARPTASVWVINERAGRWGVAGDTLRLLQVHALGGSPRDSSDIDLRWARQGDQLRWTNASYTDFACYVDTLRLVDPAKPLAPPSTTLRPVTIDRAALAGTWVLTETKQLQDRTLTDTTTLVLRADGTMSRTMGWWGYGGYGNFSYERHRQDGKWGLFPGNILATSYPDDKGVFHGFGDPAEVTLRDNQLTFDGCRYADRAARVYHRVSP